MDILRIDHSFYWLYMVLMIMANFSQIFGVELFLLITILRCWSILKPLSPKSTGFMWKFLVIAAIVSISYPTVFHMLLYFDKHNMEVFVYFELIAGVCEFIVIFLIVAFNLVSYFHLIKLENGRKEKKKQISEISSTRCYHRQTDYNNIYIEEEKSRKRKLRSVNTLLLITFFYVLCCLPHTIRMVFRTPSNNGLIGLLFGLILLANSSFNSIIYISRTKDIRTFYGRLFVKVICRKWSGVFNLFTEDRAIIAIRSWNYYSSMSKIIIRSGNFEHSLTYHMP